MRIRRLCLPSHTAYQITTALKPSQKHTHRLPFQQSINKHHSLTIPYSKQTLPPATPHIHPTNPQTMLLDLLTFIGGLNAAVNLSKSIHRGIRKHKQKRNMKNNIHYRCPACAAGDGEFYGVSVTLGGRFRTGRLLMVWGCCLVRLPRARPMRLSLHEIHDDLVDVIRRNPSPEVFACYGRLLDIMDTALRTHIMTASSKSPSKPLRQEVPAPRHMRPRLEDVRGDSVQTRSVAGRGRRDLVKR